MNKFVCFFLLISLSSFAQSQELQGIDPKDVLQPVGYPINILNILSGDYSQMQSPFENVATPLPNPKQSLEIFLASDQNKVSKSLESNISANVNAFFVKANMQLNKSYQYASSGLSLRICMSANYDYGKLTMQNTKLKPEAERLISTNPQAFVDRYGDYYVSSADVVKKIVVFIDIDCQNSSEVSSITSSIGGGLSFPMINGSVNVSSSQLISNAFKNDRCHISLSSLGLFDNNLLAEIPTIIKDESRSNNSFDLFFSLTKNLIHLMKEDKNKTHYYYQNNSFSNYVTVGLTRDYYTNFDRKFEKRNIILALQLEVAKLHNSFDMILKNTAASFLPEALLASFKDSLIACDNLKDKLLDLLTLCNGNCQNISTCCAIPPDIAPRIEGMKAELDKFGRTYKYNPLEIKSFGIRNRFDVKPTSSAPRKWIVQYKNPIQYNNDSPYKQLDKNQIEITVHFNSIIQVINYNPAVHNFKITAKLFDFTSQKEIPSRSVSSYYLPSNMGNYKLKTTGDLIMENPNELYSKNDIGLILIIEEVSVTDYQINTITVIPTAQENTGNGIFQDLIFRTN